MLFFVILTILLFSIVCYDTLYVIRRNDAFWLYRRFWTLSRNVENLPAIFYYVG